MRLKTIDIDPADVSLTGFASNVTGAAFTLTANVSGDGLAHQVSIRNDSATDHSGKTITLVGLDENGRAITEAVTGPNNGATVESALYYSYLTSATPSATIGADTFDIGWVDEVAYPWIPLDWRNPNKAVLNLDVTGTLAVTVYTCYQNILDDATPIWVAIAALTSEAHDTAETLVPLGVTGLRIVIESYTNSAELQLYINQADRGF